MTMPVEYRNRHDHKPCERELVIPEGWEEHKPANQRDIKGCLMRRTDGEKEWWGDVDFPAMGGYSMMGYPVALIRPKPPALREYQRKVNQRDSLMVEALAKTRSEHIKTCGDCYAVIRRSAKICPWCADRDREQAYRAAFIYTHLEPYGA